MENRWKFGALPGNGSVEAIAVAFEQWKNYGRSDPPGHRAPLIWQLHAGHITQERYDELTKRRRR